MNLEGTWCTEGIDNEHFTIKSVFNRRKKLIFKLSNERYVVFLERAKEISKKDTS